MTGNVVGNDGQAWEGPRRAGEVESVRLEAGSKARHGSKAQALILASRARARRSCKEPSTNEYFLSFEFIALVAVNGRH